MALGILIDSVIDSIVATIDGNILPYSSWK